MSQFALVIFANWVGLIVLAIFLFETLEKHMSALSDGIAAVQASLDKLATDNAKAFADLQAAIVAAGGSTTDVDAAVAALGDINTKLQAMDAAAVAAEPAQAVAPAPAPAV